MGYEKFQESVCNDIGCHSCESSSPTLAKEEEGGREVGPGMEEVEMDDEEQACCWVGSGEATRLLLVLELERARWWMAVEVVAAEAQGEDVTEYIAVEGLLRNGCSGYTVGVLM